MHMRNARTQARAFLKRVFLMKESKKKAIGLFLIFLVSYFGMSAFDTYATFISMFGHRLIRTTLLAVYFIPLALRMKRHAQNAELRWIGCCSRFLLLVLPIWAALNIISLIFF